MAMETISYEEVRRRKLEENKKKLEDLKLGHLSHALRDAVSPKTSPAKQLKRKVLPLSDEFVIRRRSNRLAKLRGQSYNELSNRIWSCSLNARFIYSSTSITEILFTRFLLSPWEIKTSAKVSTYDVIQRSRRIFKRRDLLNRIIFKRRDLLNRVYASDEARAYAVEKAEELQSQLDPKQPSLVRPMLPSHVTGGFWLGLPKYFCSPHMPKRDTWFTLIDENDEESESLYLALKNGLSAGWMGFALAHDLVDGDALVFHLIYPSKFKVFIIRSSGYESSRLGF